MWPRKGRTLQIRVSGENLVQIVSDVLDIEKVEAGKLELREEPFELRKVIEETLASFASKVIGGEIFVADDIDPFLPSLVVGDPGRIRQILLNDGRNLLHRRRCFL